MISLDPYHTARAYVDKIMNINAPSPNPDASPCLTAALYAIKILLSYFLNASFSPVNDATYNVFNKERKSENVPQH